MKQEHNNQSTVSNMVTKKNHDPFSTPARRRRIIAELSKAVLKNYCIKACVNVKRFRIETAAAIIIQCAHRVTRSLRKRKKLQFQKQTKASLIIQVMIRRKLSINKVKRLRKELWKKQALNLVKNVEKMLIESKLRVKRRQFNLRQKQMRMRRKEKAATEIQRVFRGFLGRKRYHRLQKQRESERSKQYKSILLIQTKSRQYLAIEKVKKIRQRFAAITLIIKYITKWRRYRFWKRNNKSIKIQKLFRGYICRKKMLRIKRVFELISISVEVIEENIIADLIQQALKSFCIANTPKPSKTMIVNVELGRKEIFRMIQCGASFVIQWSIDNNIIYYNRVNGFTTGVIVQQVIRSVDSAILRPNNNNNSNDNNEEHVVTVPKWDEGVESDSLDPNLLQQQWGQIIGDKKGARISADLFTDKIELIIVVVEEEPIPYRFKDICAELFPVNITSQIIVLFHCNSLTNCSFLDESSLLQFNEQQQQNEEDNFQIENTKFRFKNALVCLVNNDCDNDNNNFDGIFNDSDEEESDNDNWDIITNNNLNNDERPKTATIRILLKQPTPPPTPPPIDYDNYATIIQICYRKRFSVLNYNASVIQKFRIKYNILKNWKWLVLKTIIIMNKSATLIQCLLRKNKFKYLLYDLKVQLERRLFRYGHDFSLDEEDNWDKFGCKRNNSNINKYKNSMNCSVSYKEVESIAKKSNNNNKNKSNSRIISRPPSAVVMNLIDIAGPPPNCVIPYNDFLFDINPSTYDAYYNKQLIYEQNNQPIENIISDSNNVKNNDNTSNHNDDNRNSEIYIDKIITNSRNNNINYTTGDSHDNIQIKKNNDKGSNESNNNLQINSNKIDSNNNILDNNSSIVFNKYGIYHSIIEDISNNMIIKNNKLSDDDVSVPPTPSNTNTPNNNNKLILNMSMTTEEIQELNDIKYFNTLNSLYNYFPISESEFTTCCCNYATTQTTITTNKVPIYKKLFDKFY